MRNIRIQAKYSSLLAAIPAFGQVGVLALGGYLAIQGHITLGTFLAFATYLAQLLAPVRMMANIIAVSQQTRAAAERIFDILDSNPVVTEKPDAERLRAERGEVVVEHVNFGYLRSEPVLSDFSLRVAPGETVALVGTSGSGKSTVSLLLPRFYDTQTGTITIDGVDIRDVTLDSLRREVGVVFEDAFLFSDSVRNNIAYGRPDATDDDVRRAASVAGASDFIEVLPDGYDTMVGERGLTLSGGQRQRIAIARAVLTDPRVLVLDDATSSIDARTEEQIHATLREIMEHRTTILIAHRRSTLRLADRIIVMEDGHAVEDGTHEELMATSVRYRTLLTGPGDDAEADAIEELAAAGGVTPDLWRRDETNGSGNGVRAFVSVAPVLGLAWDGRRRARRWIRRRARGAPQISPELLAAVDALPPADDDPDVDVAAGGDQARDLPVAALRPPVPQAAADRLRSHRARHARHARRPAPGPAWTAERRAQRLREGAVRPRPSSSSSPSPPTGSLTWALHARTPAARQNGCSTRCASASSPTCSGWHSTTTTARWRVGS